jgi:hypothetical protein
MAQQAVKKDADQTRAERIRSLFKRVGAISTNAFVERCIDEGIFTESEIKAAARSAFQKVVRDALRADDGNGLPFAGQTCNTDGDGQQEWAQRTLWSFDDYELNVNERIAHRDGEHITAVRLANECEERYGKRIAIPALPARRSIV